MHRRVQMVQPTIWPTAKEPKVGVLACADTPKSSVCASAHVYCYLRARFGKPNGIQALLKSDDSENIFHWDYNLTTGTEDVYICGTSREVHFMLSERIAD